MLHSKSKYLAEHFWLFSLFILVLFLVAADLYAADVTGNWSQPIMDAPP